MPRTTMLSTIAWVVPVLVSTIDTTRPLIDTASSFPLSAGFVGSMKTGTPMRVRTVTWFALAGLAALGSSSMSRRYAFSIGPCATVVPMRTRWVVCGLTATSGGKITRSLVGVSCMAPFGGVWSHANPLISNRISVAVGLLMVSTALFASALRRMSSGSTENVACACAADADSASTTMAVPAIRQIRRLIIGRPFLEQHRDEHGVLARALGDVLSAGDAPVDDELPGRVRRRDSAVEPLAFAVPPALRARRIAIGLVGKERSVGAGHAARRPLCVRPVVHRDADGRALRAGDGERRLAVERRRGVREDGIVAAEGQRLRLNRALADDVCVDLHVGGRLSALGRHHRGGHAERGGGRGRRDRDSRSVHTPGTLDPRTPNRYAKSAHAAVYSRIVTTAPWRIRPVEAGDVERWIDLRHALWPDAPRDELAGEARAYLDGRG